MVSRRSRVQIPTSAPFTTKAQIGLAQRIGAHQVDGVPIFRFGKCPAQRRGQLRWTALVFPARPPKDTSSRCTLVDLLPGRELNSNLCFEGLWVSNEACTSPTFDPGHVSEVL